MDGLPALGALGLFSLSLLMHVTRLFLFMRTLRYLV